MRFNSLDEWSFTGHLHGGTFDLTDTKPMLSSYVIIRIVYYENPKWKFDVEVCVGCVSCVCGVRACVCVRVMRCTKMHRISSIQYGI